MDPPCKLLILWAMFARPIYIVKHKMHSVNRTYRILVCSNLGFLYVKYREKGAAELKDEYRDLYQQFGLNVVYYRKKKRLSQTQLAELVDIHRTYVSSIELGKVSVSFDVLFKLAEVLEVPPSKLFDFRE